MQRNDNVRRGEKGKTEGQKKKKRGQLAHRGILTLSSACSEGGKGRESRGTDQRHKQAAGCTLTYRVKRLNRGGYMIKEKKENTNK